MSPVKKLSTVDSMRRAADRAPGPENHRPPVDLPAEQTRSEKWPARISMTASRDMKRQLEEARLDDGIEVTARLRAMIALWQSDPQLRGRVDDLARTLR